MHPLSEAYLGTSRPSMMEFFAKTVNGLAVNYFQKIPLSMFEWVLNTHLALL